jgi:hypothetical protein
LIPFKLYDQFIIGSNTGIVFFLVIFSFYVLLCV